MYKRGIVNVVLIRELIQEVECLKYLGSQVAIYGGVNVYVKSMINGVVKVWGVIKVFRYRSLGMNAKSI